MHVDEIVLLWDKMVRPILRLRARRKIRWGKRNPLFQYNNSLNGALKCSSQKIPKLLDYPISVEMIPLIRGATIAMLERMFCPAPIRN